MKKVLVIGGKGNVGYPVTKLLAQDENVDLYLIDLKDTEDDLGDKVHRLCANALTEPDKIKAWIDGITFDSVLNFWIMGVDAAKLNVELFKGITKQFVFISTNCVLNHEYTCNINEKVERGNRFYSYGKDKCECELYFLEQLKEGFPVTIIRPTQTYSGHRIPLSVKGKSCWSVVKRMLEGKEVIIHGDGQSVWACTHALDLAPLLKPLIANEEAVGEIFQLMNPEPMTWDMVYQALADVLGVEYKPVYISTYLLENSKVYPGMRGSIHGDKHFSCIFDISKAKRYNPEYQPMVDIHKGMEMFMEYMNEHPDLKVEEPAFDEWCDNTIAAYKKMTAEFVEQI